MSDALALTDPFDLPEWLGAGALNWVATSSLDSVTVTGELRGAEGDVLPLAVLAADNAYPEPVVTEPVRVAAHHAWAIGQVAVADRAGTNTLAVPTGRLDTEFVCEAMRRFAKAVGVEPDRVSVTIRL